MRKQVLIITSVALSFFMMGTMFSVMALDGENPFSKIWEAINRQQQKIDNLDAEITELEAELDALSARKLETPDYDSGWVQINRGSWVMFQHNLNTTNLLVYVFVRTDTGEVYPIGGWVSGTIQWQTFSDNDIGLFTQYPANFQHRVMLWKIPSL